MTKSKADFLPSSRRRKTRPKNEKKTQKIITVALEPISYLQNAHGSCVKFGNTKWTVLIIVRTLCTENINII